MENCNASSLIDDYIIIGNIRNPKTRQENKYKIIYEAINSKLEKLNYFKNIKHVNIVYIVPSFVIEEVIDEMGIDASSVIFISLNELSEICLDNYLDEVGAKAWDEIKDLFAYIDGLDEELYY